MSHFLLLPTNENGLILDPKAQDELKTLTRAPFAFDEYFIYSHGWWTNATRAMSEYNEFSVEFAKTVRNANPHDAKEAMATGIHWPSMLSEDTQSIENYLEALSFYTMEKRADTIGEHAGYTLIQTIFDMCQDRAFTINLLGHSFGCKVVCSTLEEIATNTTIPKGAAINVVLLQGALDNNALDAGECYEHVLAKFPNIRFLISKSEKDSALQEAYPKAHRLANLFALHQLPPAMGAAGPSDAFKNRFAGDTQAAPVNVGYQAAQNLRQARLVIADLTPLHTNDGDRYDADSFTGHHSDIFQPEIYQLVMGFLFQV